MNATAKNIMLDYLATLAVKARAGASTSYARKSGYGYGKVLTIVAESNGWGKTQDGYWVYLQYTSKVTTITGVKSTVGQYKRFAGNTTIYSRVDLSGTQYNYLPNTKIKILQNIDTVDRIYVPATRKIWICKYKCI